MKKFLFFVMVLVVSICSVSAEVVTVKVDVPGTFGMVLLTKVDQLADVTELTVVGKLNDSDLDILSGLKNATKIDMSQTDIKSIRNCKNLTKLETISLPSTVTEVQSSAFSGCSVLKQIVAPNVETIGSHAFDNCYALTTANFPKATVVETKAFYYNKALVAVNFPKVISIGESAFQGCNGLTAVNFPKATNIGSYAFCHCQGLKYISLPVATSIGMYAFEYCSGLTSVNIPMATSIGNYAFNVCKILKTIALPSALQSLGTFEFCDSLTDVYCHVTSPFNTSAFVSKNFNPSNVTLHVPAFAVSAYKLHKSWNKCGKIVALEGKVDNVNVSSDLMLVDFNGIADNADLNVDFNSFTNGDKSSYGHLTVSAKDKWIIKDYVQTQPYHIYGFYTTLIPYSEMTADNVSVKYCFKTNQWNFISFPFDVNVSDIECPEGTLWVVRKYSGEDRAKMTGNTWQNMTNGMTLKAGEGYIIQCANSGGSSSSTNYICFTFRAVDNGNKNNIFTNKDVTKRLSVFSSSLSNNRSWNLVGNPYPCFFDTRFIEHNGVITVWNGNGYTAYSLRDDKYVLSPHEAFFVQCLDGASSMKFKTEGRQHSSELASQSVSYCKSPANSRRQVYNLTLSGAEYTDRARVVINESAHKDYEICCDASKFMSTNTTVPQLYVMEDNQRMAIDERPLSDGTITLGMYIGEPGDYTIALTAASTDKVTLIDTSTGNTTNLNADTYTFSASEGTIEDRFIVQIGDATGINNVTATKKPAKSAVFSLGGHKLTSPQKGINIINGNKVLVK